MAGLCHIPQLWKTAGEYGEARSMAYVACGLLFVFLLFIILLFIIYFVYYFIVYMLLVLLLYRCQIMLFRLCLHYSGAP